MNYQRLDYDNIGRYGRNETLANHCRYLVIYHDPIDQLQGTNSKKVVEDAYLVEFVSFFPHSSCFTCSFIEVLKLKLSTVGANLSFLNNGLIC